MVMCHQSCPGEVVKKLLSPFYKENTLTRFSGLQFLRASGCVSEQLLIRKISTTT